MRFTAARVEVIAHRGASADAPEHTWAAYDLALAQRADALELDLRMARDGALVVLHDPTLLRTAGLARHIAGLTAGDLAALAPARRPLLLADVLFRYRGRTAFLLELKDPTPAMERRLVETLGATRLDVVVQSFDTAALRRIRARMPRLAVAPLVAAVPAAPWRSAWLDGLVAAGATAVGLHRAAVDAEVVAAATERGLAVRSWTVNDEREAVALAALGVAGIITDVPARVRDALTADRTTAAAA